METLLRSEVRRAEPSLRDDHVLPHVFLYHEEAFIDTAAAVDSLKKIFEETNHSPLYCIKISNEELTFQETVDMRR